MPQASAPQPSGLLLAPRTRCLTVAASIIIALTGCSGAGADQPISTEAVSAASALTEFPPEISIAQTMLVQDCVNRAGLDMPFDSSAATTSPLDFGISNVFSSAEEARRLGYTTTIDGDADVLSQWEETLSGHDREAYFQALLGPDEAQQAEIQLPNGMVITSSKEGCIAQAQTQLWGSVEAELAFNGLVNEYLAAASDTGNDRDTRLSTLVPEFQTCMKAQGYEVDGLGAQKLAEGLFGRYRAAGDPPKPGEQALAEADFSCQERVHLRDEIATSFAQGASEWLRANEGKLLAMQEEIAAVNDRAVQIING